MYLGSDEFNNAIENTSGNAPKIRVTLEDGTTLDNIKSIKFYGGSNDSDDVSIGTTNMSRIDVTVLTDKMLTNNEIFLEQGVELADGVVEYMPIGYFVAQKPQGDIDEVRFTAYDRMQKFEKPYSSSLAYPTTSALILNELCQICGIELATTLDNAIEVTENLKGYTCREVLGYIASMHSSFACIDRYGRLNVRWYSDTPIEKSLKKIWHFEKSQDNFEIAKVEIAKDSETNYVSGSGITTLYNSNPLATQEITDDVFAKLGGFSYSVGEIEMLDDARLDPWDIVSVTYYDGKTYNIPCMTLEHDFKAYSTTVKSVGKSESENEYRFTGPTIQYLNRMAADLLVANRVIATKVDAEYVNSVAITTENFEAKVAEIKDLVVDEIDGKYAEIDLANIDIANINVGKIGELFAKVGLIDRATIVDGHVTGFLDAVEINANKITAGTLIADRLLLRGSEQSILYQLNSLSRNLLPYPYYDTTFEKNGLTFTDNDGTVTVNGKATARTDFLFSKVTLEDDSQGVALANGKTYTLSGCPSGGSSSTYCIYNNYVDNGEWKNFGRDTGKGLTFVGNGKKVMFMIRIASGATIDNLTFKPMLSEGTEVIPYEPYRERTQALTSETINGEVLTDRTITADKIIAKSITTNELDVDKIFGNEAVLNKIVSQDIFSNAVATNTVVVGKANRDEVLAENLLPYPYYETTHTEDNIKWVDNGDGTITANGTNNGSNGSEFKLFVPDDNILKAGTYTFSGMPTGSTTSTYYAFLNYYKDGTYAKSIKFTRDTTFTISEEDINTYTFLLCITVQVGTTVNNLTFKPMLEKGTVAHPYREYAKGGEGITNNIYQAGTTLIDGGKIYTGSITAGKIDVNDLFAQDITATGSITGATLVSLENNSSKVVIDKGEVAIYDFDTRGEGGFYKVGSVFASGGGMVSASGAWIFESLSTELGNDVDEMAARLNKITRRNFLLIGDSYLAGYTPDGTVDSWGVLLSQMLPQYNFNIQYITGSGFGTTVANKNFLDAIKKYTGDKNTITDILVCGGYNDVKTSITNSMIATGMLNFMTYAKSNFPNAKIHLGFCGACSRSDVIYNIKDTVLMYQSCGNYGAGYISNMEYTVKHTRFLTSDKVHPNELGQKNIAWNLASYIVSGNTSVIQQRLNCDIVAPSTVTAGIELFTSMNNETATLYHPENQVITFSGLGSMTLNSKIANRIHLGTLANTCIMGSQLGDTASISSTNAVVTIPVSVLIDGNSAYINGICTLEVMNLEVYIRLGVLGSDGKYVAGVVSTVIIPPFTATFDSLDV